MSKISLENRRILIVDDEPDVLDSLEELLNMCTTVRAGSFGEANTLLETQKFDIAILDIMGVDSFNYRKPSLGVSKQTHSNIRKPCYDSIINLFYLFYIL